MIGSGEMVNLIQKLIIKLGVSNCVSLLGNISNKEVRNHMLSANIFLFTSDKKEGWGAVLNEAMSSGCAVVASHSIGAAPYLIENRENGLMFKSGALKSLINNVELLFLDKQKRESMAKKAYETMSNEWSPQQAATNFIKLADSLLNNNKCILEKGPCSPANRSSIKL
jgi:glycosyltransferase involved in cell wall biosynthesis